MPARRDFGRLAERVEPLLLEAAGDALGLLVPGGAGLVVPVARTGVEEEERANSFGVSEMESERHVAAERESADDGPLLAAGVEQRRHVPGGRRPRGGGGGGRGR